MNAEKEFVVEAKIRGDVEIITSESGKSIAAAQAYSPPHDSSSSKTSTSARTPSPALAPAVVGSKPPVKPRRNSDVSTVSKDTNTNNNGETFMILAPSSTRIIAKYTLPPAVADAVATACRASARAAAFTAVENAGIQAQDILTMLFEESPTKGTQRLIDGWIGGAAVKALVKRLDVWLFSFLQSLVVLNAYSSAHTTNNSSSSSSSSCVSSVPNTGYSESAYSDVLKMAVCKLVVRLYLTTFVRRYTSDKSNRLSRRGCQQVSDDLGIVANWIATLDASNDTSKKNIVNANKNKKEVGGPLVNSPTVYSVGNNVSFEMEKRLMHCMQQWLSCRANLSTSADETTIKSVASLANSNVGIIDHSNRNNAILRCYADAIQTFGIKYALELYDLLRLFLKMRIDMSSSERKKVLGQCSEFYRQLQGAVQSDPTLMQAGGLGSIGLKASKDRKIFEDLCPSVGTEHCTGKKWSMEALQTDIGPIRVLISQLITAVTEAARAARNAAVQVTLLQQQQQQYERDSQRQSDNNVNRATSVDGSDSYVYGGRGKRFNSSGQLILSVKKNSTTIVASSSSTTYCEQNVIYEEVDEDVYVDEPDVPAEDVEDEEYAGDGDADVDDEIDHYINDRMPTGNGPVRDNTSDADEDDVLPDACNDDEEPLQEIDDVAVESDDPDDSPPTFPVEAEPPLEQSPVVEIRSHNNSTNNISSDERPSPAPVKPRRSIAGPPVPPPPPVPANPPSPVPTLTTPPVPPNSAPAPTSSVAVSAPTEPTAPLEVPNPFDDDEEDEAASKGVAAVHTTVASNPFDDDDDAEAELVVVKESSMRPEPTPVAAERPPVRSAPVPASNPFDDDDDGIDGSPREAGDSKPSKPPKPPAKPSKPKASS
jgi:type II secretory pathway pseudopilin PulG